MTGKSIMQLRSLNNTIINGNNHIITNLTISSSSINNIFIGSLEKNSIINDLTFVEFSCTIVGTCYGIINNCKFIGNYYQRKVIDFPVIFGSSVKGDSTILAKINSCSFRNIETNYFGTDNQVSYLLGHFNKIDKCIFDNIVINGINGCCILNIYNSIENCNINNININSTINGSFIYNTTNAYIKNNRFNNLSIASINKSIIVFNSNNNNSLLIECIVIDEFTWNNISNNTTISSGLNYLPYLIKNITTTYENLIGNIFINDIKQNNSSMYFLSTTCNISLIPLIPILPTSTSTIVPTTTAVTEVDMNTLLGGLTGGADKTVPYVTSRIVNPTTTAISGVDMNTLLGGLTGGADQTVSNVTTRIVNPTTNAVTDGANQTVPYVTSRIVNPTTTAITGVDMNTLLGGLTGGADKTVPYVNPTTTAVSGVDMNTLIG
jgi:hypothetical protein